MNKFPLEYALILFKGNKFSGQIVPALLDLAQRGIVRYLDIVFVMKGSDGGIRAIELNDLNEEDYKMFVPLGEHATSLYSRADLLKAADQLPNNCAAALLLWENLWLENISKALNDAGAALRDRGEIPADNVDQVLRTIAAKQ